MVEKKKKRKSIYDRPLKDINKDGKVNFGDTWLGDALGFDGKVGIQKGRPGLKESLKGARRGNDKPKKEPKPSASPRGRPSTSRKKVDVEEVARRGIEKAEGSRPRARPGSVRPQARPDRTPKGVPAPSKVEVTPLDKAKVPTTTKEPKITFTEWKKLTRKERRDRGLPETTLQWQNQGKFGIPKVTGMAKGGMARFDKTGKRDYKGKGMFYDSKSPRGYK